MMTRGRVPAAVARGAFIAMALVGFGPRASAQESAKADTSSADAPDPSRVEIGAGDASQGSYKAGEYNGLQNAGAFAIGNFDLRNAGGSTRLWRLSGTDLGLDTRSVSAEFGVQGKYRLTFGFDSLRRNQSDTYQTPYDGAGTNILTLPANWVVPTIAGGTASNSATNPVSARGLVPGLGTGPYIDPRTNSPTFGGVISPTAAQVAQVNSASVDLGAFHNVNLYTTRTKFDAGFKYDLSDDWTLDADVRPEHKDGLRALGTVSANTGSDISTIIPNKIDQDHTQVSTNLNYKGSKSFAQVGYYGSFFKNNVASMSWQNWATGPSGGLPGTVNFISSAPSNDFNQLNGSAGYNFSRTTHLVANGSYGRTTQNDAFVTDSTMPVVPVTSLHGLVVSSLFNAKLSTKVWKKLNLSAGYKFSDHDNQSPINIYQYADAGAAPVANANFPAGPNNPLGAVLAQNANANRPYSSRLNQVNLDADYPLGGGQWITAGYDLQNINRDCTGSWIDCEDVDRTNENTVRAEWRAGTGSDVSARVDYAYSARRGSMYNEDAFLALVPYANVSPASATGGATALSYMLANGWDGWGPALGYAPTTGNMNLFFPSNNALANTAYANNNRISELPGFERYFVADRDRNKLRTSVAWQAGDSLSLDGAFDLNRDHYPSTVYGLQDARGWSADLDATYSPTDHLSADAFYTYETQHSLSTGDTYTANSNTGTITGGQAGIVGFAGNACDGYTTLLQRNNNNKLDPCLPWSASVLDQVHTVGAGLQQKAGKLDLVASLTFTRARSNNDTVGGNWANNPLDGPGGAPTMVAAVFIAATPFPTVKTNTLEVRLTGGWALAKQQTLRLAYAYLYMTSTDWMYDGLDFGPGTVSALLPTNEQPFGYKVNLVSLSYVKAF